MSKVREGIFGAATPPCSAPLHSLAPLADPNRGGKLGGRPGAGRFFLFERNLRAPAMPGYTFPAEKNKLEKKARQADHITADSSVFKCFEEAKGTRMDEKVFAALRPRAYLEHLYTMQPLWITHEDLVDSISRSSDLSGECAVDPFSFTRFQ